MAVKVKERPPGSGKWWVFTDYKGKRCARYIPQGKRKADEIAAKITEKLGILDAAQDNGITLSLRQVVLDDPNRIVMEPTGAESPLFKDYAGTWLDGCEARGLKHTTYRSYGGILKVHLLPVFGDLPLSLIDRKTVKALALEKRKAGASLSMVRLILCVVSAIFTSAIEDGIVRQCHRAFEEAGLHAAPQAGPGSRELSSRWRRRSTRNESTTEAARRRSPKA